MKQPTKNPAIVYLSRWAEGSDTHATMRTALDQIALLLGGGRHDTFPWHELRFEDVRGVPAKLSTFKPNTINNRLAALRGVLETAKDMGLMSELDFLRIKIKNVRGKAIGAGRALSDDEKQRIVDGLASLELHDAALISVLLGAGARRVEAISVKRDDYNSQTGRILLYGKGKKERSVPVGVNWRAPIEMLRATMVKNEIMFPLTRRQVSYAIDRICDQLDMEKFTPHDLRRSFGTHICKVADVAVAQRLLGHSDVKTTLLYDRRGKEAEDDALKDW